MERAEWLKQEREKAEELYSLWGRYAPREQLVGSYESETHLEYLRKFLDRIPPHSTVLSAGCGAGRNDEILLEAGHRVMGIDQSEGITLLTYTAPGYLVLPPRSTLHETGMK